jgi:AraC-like DNA-binding protein
VAQLIRTTLHTKPANGSTHWSVRTVATETGISKTSVQRYFQLFGLQPHRTEGFKLSTTRSSWRNCGTWSACMWQPSCARPWRRRDPLENKTPERRESPGRAVLVVDDNIDAAIDMHFSKPVTPDDLLTALRFELAKK